MFLAFMFDPVQQILSLIAVTMDELKKLIYRKMYRQTTKIQIQIM